MDAPRLGQQSFGGLTKCRVFARSDGEHIF